jgi:hypothetical protein
VFEWVSLPANLNQREIVPFLAFVGAPENVFVKYVLAIS